MRIIWIPGELLPLTKQKPGNFGIIAYEILNAVDPDFTILSLYKDEYKEEYFEEMAGVLEVLQAICVARGYSLDELETMRAKKADERGGFKDKVFLEYVE